ncbi:MAG: hypothetical protein M3O87_06310 [Candidatus Dormibacteraeota bacterium]|nr:hypothetical protein [Candidatus Dormibacteraeota bacterium]
MAIDPTHPVSTTSPPPNYGGADVVGPAAQLPAVPEVIQVNPGAPQAEDGKTTTEYRLVQAGVGLIVAGTAFFDTLAGTGTIHVDPGVVISANGISASLVSFITIGYAFARSWRKQGTQG